MVKMINKAFGNEMWVAEDRVEEYKAAGCVLATSPSKEKPAAKPKNAKAKKKCGDPVWHMQVLKTCRPEWYGP